jgi:uncharacterized glyoxalase superfamily protein PhnB
VRVIAKDTVAHQEVRVRSNQSAPAAAVVPVLIYADVAKAIDWLCTAFGFEERLRAPDRDGTVGHAQLDAGDGAVMIGRAGGPFKAMRSGELHQYVLVNVENVDEHFARARRAGAEVLQPPEDMPFGVRHYTVTDLEGHWWTFSQNIADVHPSEWGAILKS